MSNDLPTFLGGEEGEPSDVQALVETPASPEVEAPAEGPARGADGKFISTDTPQEPQPAPEPEAPAPVAAAAPASPPPGFVPLAVVNELREEIRALRQPPPQPRVVPDPDQDPEGYREFEQEQVHTAILNQRLDFSQEMATDKFGEDRVAAGVEWFKQQSPARQQEILSLRHPYGFLVTEAEKAQAQADLTPEDIAAFRAWKAQQANGGQPLAAPQPAASAAPPAPAAPRSSIAAAPSAAGPAATPVLDGEHTYARMFNR